MAIMSVLSWLAKKEEEEEEEEEEEGRALERVRGKVSSMIHGHLTWG
jgi:hypothetical protein